MFLAFSHAPQRELELGLAIAHGAGQAGFEVLVGRGIETFGAVYRVPLARRRQPLPHLDAGRRFRETQPVGRELLGIVCARGTALRAFDARGVPHDECAEAAADRRGQQGEGELQVVQALPHAGEGQGRECQRADNRPGDDAARRAAGRGWP